jgi:hypothetical protein
MPVPLQTTLLLICSNVFMTFAWYAHLKQMSGRPWYLSLGEPRLTACSGPSTRPPPLRVISLSRHSSGECR